MLTALTSKAYRKALFNRLSGFSAAAELPAGGRAEQRLSRAMFMVLGRLAKMDGRVTQEEIDYAGQIMQRMALIGEKRREAIVAYDQGKYPDARSVGVSSLGGESYGAAQRAGKIIPANSMRGCLSKG